MPLEPAVTDLDKLKEQPVVSKLVAWNAASVQRAKLDRGEITVWVPRELIRDAVNFLKSDPELDFNYLADVTCVDWIPAEPRFEVVYHMLSLARKARIRLKVGLNSDEPNIESVVPVFPSANFFEREIFDLFGIRFSGHPNLRRILMPEDWEGHPLRKDYPVEGYR